MRRAFDESNLIEHNLHLEGFDLQRGGDNLIQDYKVTFFLSCFSFGVWKVLSLHLASSVLAH